MNVSNDSGNCCLLNNNNNNNNNNNHNNVILTPFSNDDERSPVVELFSDPFDKSSFFTTKDGSEYEMR